MRAARGIAVLAICALVTALALVSAKHEARRLFGALQGLERERDALDVEWTQLLLEQSTLATEAAVDWAARTRLGMHVPDPRQVVYLRP